VRAAHRLTAGRQWSNEIERTTTLPLLQATELAP
jgi:hypothetical protein